MLVTTRNADPRAPDLAPALRNGQTLWTFHLQKDQWASNASNHTTCVIQTQPALKSGSRRSATMRCRSIGYSGLVHSVHQSDQSFSGNRSGCLCKHATANLRAKLKSPKLSSWEDCSPSRSTANNQKRSESSSRSLSPRPLSYSNPCITSVYASHLSLGHVQMQNLPCNTPLFLVFLPHPEPL